MQVEMLDVADLIVEEDRQRQFFDQNAINELAESIKKIGLINALTVNTLNGNRYLIAGERRFKAINKLHSENILVEYNGYAVPAGKVPVIDRRDLPTHISAQIELHENSKRENLTWQEKDRAVARVAELLKEVNESPEPVTLNDIAQLLKPEGDVSAYDEGKVKQALRRQEFMNDPVVAKAKTAKDADKIIQKKMEEAKKQRLAEKFKEIEVQHSILFGDCKELILGCAANTFDVICSDPIYGINMHEANAFQRVKMQEGKRHEYDDSYENWVSMFEVMPRELYRVAKQEAHCYLFCDILRFKELKDKMAEAGWDVWARPVIWYKGNIGSLPRPEHGPRYTYEVVLYAIKGNKKTKAVFHDVINIPQTTGHDHGAGKPPEVYQNLLERSVNPGDVVLDFCAGSFPILVAANHLDVTAHAWELDERWKADAEIRKLEGRVTL